MKLPAYLFLIFSLALFSCKNDDADPQPINEISYGNDVYNATHGLILDYGEQAGTHYNYDFYVSDGKITTNGNLLNVDESVSYYVYADFKSLGTTRFSPGTYAFSRVRQFVDKDIFVSPTLLIRNGQAFEAFPGTGGTITISGADPNYTITYDLIFTDKLLSGSYSGTFDIQDGIF